MKKLWWGESFWMTEALYYASGNPFCCYKCPVCGGTNCHHVSRRRVAAESRIDVMECSCPVPAQLPVSMRHKGHDWKWWDIAKSFIKLFQWGRREVFSKTWQFSCMCWSFLRDEKSIYVTLIAHTCTDRASEPRCFPGWSVVQLLSSPGILFISWYSSLCLNLMLSWSNKKAALRNVNAGRDWISSAPQARFWVGCTKVDEAEKSYPNTVYTTADCH